jgi:hypothetical protein
VNALKSHLIAVAAVRDCGLLNVTGLDTRNPDYRFKYPLLVCDVGDGRVNLLHRCGALLSKAEVSIARIARFFLSLFSIEALVI